MLNKLEVELIIKLCEYYIAEHRRYLDVLAPQDPCAAASRSFIAQMSDMRARANITLGCLEAVDVQD